jgi:ribosomal protein S6
METDNSEQEFKQYEISFLGLNESVGQAISSLLIGLGAEVFFSGSVRQIDLMYPIKKHQNAFFGYCHFQASADKIENLKQDLTLQKDIIRFLIITPPIKRFVEKAKFAERVFSPEHKESAPILTKEIPPKSESLSNELLEQKLEEILK